MVLDGSKSSDDIRILDYVWTVASGDRAGLQLEGEFSPRLTVRNLKEGIYTFNLTVFDGIGQADDDSVTIQVKGFSNCLYHQMSSRMKLTLQ